MIFRRAKTILKRSTKLVWVMQTLKGFLVRRPLVDWVLWYFPGSVRMFDGVKRVLPNVAKSEIKLWRKIPEGPAEVEAVIAAYAGGDFIDIGSFWGSYAWFFAPKAKAGARFVLLEPFPDPKRHLFLNASAMSHAFPQVQLSVLSFPAGDGGKVAASFPLGEGQHPCFANDGAAGGSDLMQSIRVDDLVRLMALKPSFIKLDVEGAEYGVLLGMSETLKVHRPVLMLEDHPGMYPPGVTLDLVHHWLHEHGYQATPLSDRHGIWRFQASHAFVGVPFP
jgi:FkbM family methyltransferase